MTDEAKPVPCPNCKATGEIYMGTAPNEYLIVCDNCDGSGQIGPDSTFYEWAKGLKT